MFTISHRTSAVFLALILTYLVTLLRPLSLNFQKFWELLFLLTSSLKSGCSIPWKLKLLISPHLCFLLKMKIFSIYLTFKGIWKLNPLVIERQTDRLIYSVDQSVNKTECQISDIQHFFQYQIFRKLFQPYYFKKKQWAHKSQWNSEQS